MEIIRVAMDFLWDPHVLDKYLAVHYLMMVSLIQMQEYQIATIVV